MKALFFMRHPGYVRNFESTLAELAERGHRVHVAFDRYYMPWQPDRNPIDPLCARYPDITHDASPVPAASVSGSVGIQLGVLTDYLRYFSNEYAQAPKLRARARKAVPAALRDPIDRLARNPSRRRSLGSALAAMERAVAVPDEVVDYIRAHAPDLVDRDASGGARLPTGAVPACSQARRSADRARRSELGQPDEQGADSRGA